MTRLLQLASAACFSLALVGPALANAPKPVAHPVGRPMKMAPKMGARQMGGMHHAGAGHIGRPIGAHAFHGHQFHGRLAWDHGHWRHEERNGRFGWWWDVDGAAYYYDAPQYPYPADVSEVEFMDPAEADVGPGPGPEAGPPPPLPPLPPTLGDLVGGVVGGIINSVPH